jgi:hypothetical protein
MTPEDRAKVLAVQCLQREVYGEPDRGKYKLEAYLVAVTATATNYGNGDVGRRVKYAIERATTLDGEPRNKVKNVILEERCVLQEGEFESADAREVYGKTTTTRRTRTVSLNSYHVVMIVLTGFDSVLCLCWRGRGSRPAGSCRVPWHGHRYKYSSLVGVQLGHVQVERGGFRRFQLLLAFFEPFTSRSSCTSGPG